MSLLHTSAQDSPCAVQQPAGWFDVQHTPNRKRGVRIEDGLFVTDCATCDITLVLLVDTDADTAAWVPA